jgi:DNA (cytosine-5)-methyltransferase 1
VPKFELDCHKDAKVGFRDVYGRLRWDDFSSTITGGCLNPSKGRFLHPEQDRAITAREAALLQTFPRCYKFPEGVSKTSIALQIGNALPPKFSYIQSANILKHVKAAIKSC